MTGTVGQVTTPYQNGAMADTDTHDAHEPARFVELTKVGDITAARVLAARLQAEGIEVRIHSQAFGPYPVTVGQMAESELWVMSDRVEEASRILLDAEVNDVIYTADPTTPERVGMPMQFRLIALGVGIVLFILVALRFARVY